VELIKNEAFFWNTYLFDVEFSVFFLINQEEAKQSISNLHICMSFDHIFHHKSAYPRGSDPIYIGEGFRKQESEKYQGETSS
jgi:hypothetical protein